MRLQSTLILSLASAASARWWLDYYDGADCKGSPSTYSDPDSTVVECKKFSEIDPWLTSIKWTYTGKDDFRVILYKNTDCSDSSNDWKTLVPVESSGHCSSAELGEFNAYAIKKNAYA